MFDDILKTKKGKTIISKILPIGTITGNRHMYSKEVLESAIKVLDGKMLPVYMNKKEGDLTGLIGKAEIFLDGNSVCVKVHPINNPLEPSAYELYELGTYVFSPRGIGAAKVVESTRFKKFYKVLDYTFSSIVLIPLEESAAFKDVEKKDNV